jgi:hypothetical protein
MPTSAAPAPPKDKPATIDPDLEGGTVALAEQLLSPNPGCTELALRLQNALRTFTNTKDRVDVAIARQEEVAAAIRAQPCEADRKKLTFERTGLSSELLHSPADIEAAAKDVAQFLSEWASVVISTARAQARELYAQGLEKRNAQVRLNNRVIQAASEGESKHLSAAERAEISTEFAKLTEELRPTEKAADQLEALATAAQYSLTSRFGEGSAGSLYSEPGRTRWIEGVREATRRKTGALSGATSALKPRGW